MTDKIRIKKFIQNNRKRFTKWGDAAAEKNLHNSMEANDLLVRFCDAVISFIDSLQEEPVAPKVLEDMLNAKTAAESLGISQEEHDRIVDELIYGKEPELVDVDDLPHKEEEPVSEDLSAELDAYIKENFTIEKDFLEKYGLEEKDYMYSMDKSDMLKMIRHFTNNYKVPTSDFLEEAAKLCVSDYFCITNEEDWDEHAVDALNIFKIAAKWQKEKDAILPKVWNRENLDDFSYQTAYDLSNDWVKETPTWHDVEMACKLGANWQKEQTITKACDWLKRNADSYTWYNEFEGESGMTEDFVDEFKKEIQ